VGAGIYYGSATIVVLASVSREADGVVNRLRSSSSSRAALRGRFGGWPRGHRSLRGAAARGEASDDDNHGSADDQHDARLGLGLLRRPGSGRNAADLHDVDNLYSWAGCCDGNCDPLCQPNAAAAATCAAQAEDGTEGCGTCAGTCYVNQATVGTLTTVWDWLNQVNAANFAGHSDWRLPSESACNTCYSGNPSYGCSSCSAHELETILLSAYPCGPQPCISSIFGPTASNIYWSSVSDVTAPTRAWCVSFSGGYATNLPKVNGLFVRAVRGGS